jgi:hypothetical protein
MNNYLQKDFYAQTLSCKCHYNKNFFKDEINENDIKIDNLEKEIIYCKNEVDYIRSFIEHMKEKVIKKCKNLSSVKIILSVFDKNNIIHKFMVVLANMMYNFLKIKQKINFYKSIIVFIEYEGQTVFIGNLNFTGLN